MEPTEYEQAERQQWLMFDAKFYGPTPPWEHGLVMGEFGWEFEYAPTCDDLYAMEHYMGW